MDNLCLLMILGAGILQPGSYYVKVSIASLNASVPDGFNASITRCFNGGLFSKVSIALVATVILPAMVSVGFDCSNCLRSCSIENQL